MIGFVVCLSVCLWNDGYIVLDKFVVDDIIVIGHC